MKSYSELTQQKAHVEEKLEATKVKHSHLNQIDMLSGEGSKLREKINMLRGCLATLNWVLSDNVNGDLYDME